MGKDHRDALMLYLENSADINLVEQTWGFVNATPLPEIPQSWTRSLRCQQEFKPDYLDLKARGYDVSAQWSGSQEGQSGTLFLPGRNRKWNEHVIAQIWNSLSPGQSLVIAGEKRNGGASLRKWLSGYLNLADSFAKHHALVFRARRNWESPDIPVAPIERIVDGYHVREGIFSSQGPDCGSLILTQFMNSRIRGNIADLGAGWGFLSCELMRHSNNVRAIDLFEANGSALRLAQKNINDVPGIEISFNWIDVTQEFKKKPYDWVIMNPPFHSSGRSSQPEVGIRFIETAASTLPSGGRMLMVANRNLPYEKTISEKFRQFTTLVERDGFKVIEAVK